MKVNIEFDLPEERYEYKITTNSISIFNCLFDLVNYKLRDEIKYGDHSDDKLKAYEDVRDYIIEYLDGEGFNFNYFE